MASFRKYGIHVPNGGTYPDFDLMLQLAGDCYTLLDDRGYIDAGRKIRQARGEQALLLVRYYHPSWWTLDPRAWASECARRYAEHRELTRHCTWANEQQLEFQIDWNAPPTSAEARACYEKINAWNAAFIEEFRRLCPDAILHYPALAPNHQSDLDDARWGWMGYDILRPSIQMVNWLDVHVYWKAGGAGLWDADRTWYAGRYELVRKFFPEHIFFISECGQFSTTDHDLPRQLGDFFAMIAPVPYIAGATPFIWADPTRAHWQNDWHRYPDLPGLVNELRTRGDALQPATVVPWKASPDEPPQDRPGDPGDLDETPPKEEEKPVAEFIYDGRQMTLSEFSQYVAGLPDRKIVAVCMHHTAKPATPEDWQKAGGWAHYLNVLIKHYRDVMEWNKGPHLFIFGNKIGILTPLTMDANGASGHNAGVWHVEVVGNYMDTAPSGETLGTSVAVAAILLKKAGLVVGNGLTYHRRLAPGTTECPGDAWAAAWDWYAELVAVELATRTRPVTLPEHEPAMALPELMKKHAWWEEEEERKLEQADKLELQIEALRRRAREIHRSNLHLAYRIRDLITMGTGG